MSDWLSSKTSLQCSTQNVVWGPITKSKTPQSPTNKPRPKGELPYQLEIGSINCSSSSSSSQSTSSSNKTTKEKKTDYRKKNFVHKQQKINMETMELSNPFRFAHIIPSVREASGGWNTQSNEVIEKRIRERQKRFAEENNSEKSSGDSCNATSSSETSDSYKTALQDSYESRIPNSEQERSEKLVKLNLQRYNKNALMSGLLRNADCTEDTTTDSSDYYETISCDDMASGIMNLKIDENTLQNERLNLLFRSEEDEDVYCHALQGQIQKDPEWQKLRLKRKGTETILSPRQYYMNIDDDEFAFESRKPN